MYLDEARPVAFRLRRCAGRTPSRPLACSAQTIQQHQENHRHRERHVQVGVAAAQQRLRDLEAVRGFGLPQPIVPTPGINPNQFVNRMKMKIVAKNQNVFFTRSWPMMPSRNHSSDFDQPLPEILRAVRHRLHLRIANRAKMIRPIATIHVTNIEFVTGKVPSGPRGIVKISSAFGDSPSSFAGSALG